jgi:hypothetical protein
MIIGMIYMMLLAEKQEEFVYMTENRKQQMQRIAKQLQINEQMTSTMINLMETFLSNWGKRDNWDAILYALEKLPGTPEERMIFMMGYMTHVYMKDY